MLEDLLPFEHVEVGQGDRAADRVTGEGEAVQERGPVLQEGLHQPVRGDHGAEGGVARRQSLGHGDDVGLVGVAVGPEPVPEASEGADDLVGDQQHAVAIADLPHPLEVARRRGEAAAGVLHGLEVHGRDRVRTLPEDGPLYFVRRPPAEGNLVIGEDRGPVEVRVGHLDGAAHQGFEGGLEVRDPGDRQGAHGRPVVGDVTADDLGALRLAGDPEVLPDQLPGGFDRF